MKEGCYVVMIIATLAGVSLSIPAAASIEDGYLRFGETLQQRQQYFNSLYNRTKQEIEQLRRDYDMEKRPEFRTSIESTPTGFILKRQIGSLTFSHKTANVVSAVLRRFRYDDACMPSAVVVDEKGRKFEQRFASDGKLTSGEDKYHVYLKGEFTPCTSSGELFPAKMRVKYTFQRMSGTMIVDYSFAQQPALKVTELTFESTLGPEPRTLRYYVFNQGDVVQECGEYSGADDSVIRTGEATIRNPIAKGTSTGRGNFGVWTDGSTGYEVLAVDWQHEKIASEFTRNDRIRTYLTIEVKNKRRCIDMTFINVHREDAFVPDQDAHYRFAFAVLPFKKLKPEPILFSNSWPLEYHTEGWTERCERQTRLNAEHGSNFTQGVAFGWIPTERAEGGITVNSSLNGAEFPPSPKAYRSAIQRTQHYRTGFIQYVEARCIKEADALANGSFPSKEALDRTRIWMSPEEESRSNILCCLNDDYFRWNRLAIVKRLLDAFPEIDGFYFDSLGLRYCCNPHHEPGGSYSSNILGAIEFAESLHILFDSYPKPKTFLVHYNSQTMAAPLAAPADVQMPGEEYASWILNEGNLPRLPEAVLWTAYNAYLTGTPYFAYSSRSFDFAGPAIFEQMLLGCGNPWLYASPFSYDADLNKNSYTGVELAYYHRYVDPVFTFLGDTESAELRHPLDGDYSQYVRQASQPDVSVLVYTAIGNALAVIIDEQHKAGTVDIDLHAPSMGIRTGEALVFDLYNGDARIVPVSADGGFRLEKIDASREPRFLLMCERPTAPKMLWHGVVFHNASLVQNGSTGCSYTATATSYPGGESYLVIYCADLGNPQCPESSFSCYDPKNKTVTLHALADGRGNVRVDLRFAHKGSSRR